MNFFAFYVCSPLKTTYFIIGCFATCSLSTLAQGKIHFANLGGGVNAPVFLPDCSSPISGSAFHAGLYAGPQNSLEPALLLVSDSVTTFASAGYFSLGFVDVAGVLPGQVAALQVRVWETSAGSYESAAAGAGLHGKSNLFEVELGRPDGPPVALVGLQSFCLIPEPSTLAMTFSAMALLVFIRATLFCVPRGVRPHFAGGKSNFHPFRLSPPARL
jgi:hypothetical protein